MMKRLLVLVGAVSLSTPAVAQFPPERTENLKVLPADMPVQRVIGVMRGFSQGLGVRCQYCHVGEPGAALSTFDFASDEKPSKEKARVMLQMVQAINNSHLGELPDRSDPAVRVTCATCHHGVSVPRPLTDVLAAEAEANGVDAGLAKYEELREQYYGSDSYNFSEGALIGFAQALGRQADPVDQAKILDRNLELFPSSVQTLVGLGQAHSAMGHKEVAIEYVERALELAPGTAFIERVLRQIRGS